MSSGIKMGEILPGYLAGSILMLAMMDDVEVDSTLCEPERARDERAGCFIQIIMTRLLLLLATRNHFGYTDPIDMLTTGSEHSMHRYTPLLEDKR